MIAVFFTIAIAIVVTVSVISQRRLNKCIRSIEYDKKFAEKELRDLKCRLAERTRVACDLSITPLDIAHAPDDFYWFHRITAAEEFLEKIFIELYPPVLSDDKKLLAKVSAMCMIAMEVSDMHETNMLRTSEELL